MPPPLRTFAIIAVLSLSFAARAAAHDIDPAELATTPAVSQARRIILARQRRDLSRLFAVAPDPAPAEPPLPAPPQSQAFTPFADKLKLRWDDQFLYIDSSGLPDHRMMVGITAWQQQVPLPQRYTGDNAWRVPLHPVPAANPLSAKTHFFRGAIAIAANGVPIFNPIKNDGRTDTFLAGELDEFGGHAGRADDYHYHTAPVHLQPLVGKGQPIAYALDGYPIYGLAEPNGSPVGNLDAFNGHADAAGNYHYHASKTYPYLNGGFHGEVVERGGQVDPQPRASPVRPDTRPLRSAKVTGFVSPKPGSYSLTYDVRGEKRSINYSIEPDGTCRFEFIDGRGNARTETYRRRD
jgi:hypothetical protein